MFKKIIHKFFHIWKFIKKLGINNYYECAICGKRKWSKFPNEGYSPLDWEWLNEEK